MGNYCNYIKISEVNLHKLHRFLLLNDRLYMFFYRKLFIRYFFTKFCTLDPDPHLKIS